MPTNGRSLPLVYSCSGCSSAAQLANHVALRLDRIQAAEMSCIAGVGGGVAPLVKLARSGRLILAIDGCAMACARQCLAQQGVTPEHHLQLGELGVKKRQHMDFDPSQADAVVAEALALLAQRRAMADAPE